ncbi:multicopper oxidase family protein [Nostoc sp. FACHB-133]|uniref:multicopper oxidase family protein n=1 Tax=Nostoc sp. FACHB-133 TaxID=2692835 RepID=UPI001685B76B|nr:multicopper oxidase domain-containing protein [Nostoc sp. FACHB-133]MBD2527035.1 multicopper oxidase domain-containing protein [Nostoc sp. FACHB-133]
MVITRRDALNLIGKSTLMLPLGALSMGAGQFSPQIKLFQQPFRIPPVLNPVHSDSNGDYYEITMQQSQVEILPGLNTKIWGYNGMTPGPTIRAQRGRQSIVRFINNLPESMVIHLHGMASLPQYDGYAEDFIPFGYYKDYIYPNNRAATLWYHDHALHQTSRHVYMGLAGMYIIEDDLELNLPLPKGDYDIPLIIQDKRFDSDGSLIFDDRRQRGLYGDIMLVNGVPYPRMEVANRKYRFRILNAGTSRTCQLQLSTKDDLIIIASDAGLLSAPVRTKNLRIGVAERYEFIIDFSKYPIGTQVVLQNPIFSSNIDSDNRTQQVMRFDVVRQESDDSDIPNTLRPVQIIPVSSAVRTRTFSFGRGNQLWQINNRTWDKNRIDANPSVGDVEIWNLVNTGGEWIHPVHIHLVDLQMIDRNGLPPLPYERGWKDVFLVESGQTVRVIAKYGPHAGKYMMHCHNLVHEDHDMMTQFEVGSGGANPITTAKAKPLPAPPF